MSECVAYQWIGQAVCHCDNCGRPAWEHPWDQRVREPFSGRRFHKSVSKVKREIQHLRWRYTMHKDPTYCPMHEPQEWQDMTLEEIILRWTELERQ